MKPIDWLRARARRERKPATGGYVQPDQMPVLLGGCAGPGYLVYSNPTIQVDDDEPQPVINLTLTAQPMAELTDQEKATILSALQYPVRTGPIRTESYRSSCGCWPTYMYCYCDLRKRAPQ